MKLFLAGALCLAAGPALAATVTLTGEATRADPFGGLQPFDLVFDTSFEVTDSQVTGGSLGGDTSGLPVLVSGTVTINDEVFGDGDIALQIFSNDVFGIRVNVSSVRDGTTDVTPGINDFRLFGASFGDLTLVDATLDAQTIPFLDIAFFEAGQDAPSQASVLGSYTLKITDYDTSTIAPVTLPASVGYGVLGLAALGLLRRRKG